MDVANETILILSDRESKVLNFMAEGLTSRRISNLLHITEVTVIFHRQNIKRKLQAKNACELIHKAHRYGILR